MNKKIISCIIVCFIILVGYILYGINELFKIEVEFSKFYNTMYVEAGDIVDCKEMRKPSEKYSVLGQIRGDVRYKFADYMEKNNLKLSEGKQKVYRMYDVTLEKLIEVFKTEKIK